MQNQPVSDLVPADCARFWPNGSGPEASRCAIIIRSTSGQCFPSDPDRMRIGSGMITGKIQKGNKTVQSILVKSEIIPADVNKWNRKFDIQL